MSRTFFSLAAFLSVSLVACVASPQTTPHLTENMNNSSGANMSVTSTLVENPERGAQVSIGIAALAGANGVLANGASTVQYFGERGTIVAMILNVASAQQNMIYVAWLGDESGKHVRLGKLESIEGEIRHGIRFETDLDLRNYPNIVISLEQREDVSEPGEIVANGILKEIAR